MNTKKALLTVLLSTSALYAMEQQLPDALRSGNLGLAQQLIEQRADVNVSGRYNYTPLMLAVLYGDTRMAGLLIDNQANVNAQRHNSNETPLMLALHGDNEAIVKLLLAAQADINAKDNDSRTPLMEAARGHYAGIVRILLDAKSDLFLQDKRGKTALEIAQTYNRTEIAQMIQQESIMREEIPQLIVAAQTLCAIRTHEPSSILSLIPNELLFLILGHISPDGFQRLLSQAKIRNNSL
jgi:replicative DNA helicase